MAKAKTVSVSKKQRALALELAALARTQGWTATVDGGGPDAYGETWPKRPGVVEVKLERTDGEVAVALHMTVTKKESWSTPWRGFIVEGDTTYNGLCFTRRGVDCASCWLQDKAKGEFHTYADVATLLAGEFERCLSNHNRSKTLVSVPGLPFQRQPEWFAETAKTLLAGKVVRLYPHGMGTGYTLSRRRSTWGRPADSELVKKLGVGPVYVETFDHD